MLAADVSTDAHSRERLRSFLATSLAPLRSPGERYAASLAVFALITAAQRLLRPVLLPVPFMGAFAAVTFASWFGGVGPSVLVICASVVSSIYFFLHPVDSFALEGTREVASIIGFVVVSLFITAIGAAARAGYLRLEDLSRNLSAAEERWRSLAEAIPQVVWSADGEGRIDYQNRRWIELTGRTIDEARERGWPLTVHPDDLETVLQRWTEALRTGSTYEVESRLMRAVDGTWRWHLSRAVPLRDAGGKVVKWFGTSTDIDDQKRSVERSRFLADAGNLLGSSLDYEATLQHVARAAVPAFADWASVDLLADDGSIERVAVAHADPEKVRLAKELFEKYPPRTDDPVGVAKVLRTGKAELYPEIPDELLVQALPDPELLRIVRGLALRSSISAPIIARGRTLGVLGFAMAESARKYSEADLVLAEELGRRAGVALDNARLYREAQTASRLKDEFLSTVSHELRTPLTAIVGWAHMLSGQADREKVERGTRIIERNARAQAQLIDDLLDVSRIVTGRMRLHVRPFSPIQVIEAALESVRPSVEARGQRLISVLDPGAGPIVGDPDRLQQVVWNLLSNAVKFTAKGGRIQVRLARVDSHVEIEVADNGAGIDKQFLPRIFDRFTQADASVSRTHGGLGLGMSIARHLTELHGGTIEAQSEGPGQGARFLVKLPLAAARHPEVIEVAPPPAAVVEPAQPVAAASLKDTSVLVVEDAPDARELIREVFDTAGASVAVASSAAEARELLKGGAPDLLVSDVGMPGEDGYAFIRRLRAEGLHMPAIALTAYARGEDRTRALIEGFDFHMAKPIDPHELVMVAAALRRRKR